MCFVVYMLLTDRPHDASWLTADQRTWLQGRLDSEQAQREAVRKFSLVGAFTNYKIWLLTLAYFGQNISSYGLVFFLPLIVKGLGVSTNWIGLTAALPYLCAFVAMIAWGYHSDLSGERKWHVAGASLVAAGGLATCVLVGVGHPVITMVALCIAMMGQQSLIPTFWAIPSAMLTGGGRGRRVGDGQRGRQPWRMVWPVDLRNDQGYDGEHQSRAAVPGSGSVADGALRPCGWP